MAGNVNLLLLSICLSHPTQLENIKNTIVCKIYQFKIKQTEWERNYRTTSKILFMDKKTTKRINSQMNKKKYYLYKSINQKVNWKINRE